MKPTYQKSTRSQTPKKPPTPVTAINTDAAWALLLTGRADFILGKGFSAKDFDVYSGLQKVVEVTEGRPFFDAEEEEWAREEGIDFETFLEGAEGQFRHYATHPGSGARGGRE